MTVMIKAVMIAIIIKIIRHAVSQQRGFIPRCKSKSKDKKGGFRLFLAVTRRHEYVVVAYIGTACIFATHIVTAYTVMAYMILACTVMAYIVMA